MRNTGEFPCQYCAAEGIMKGEVMKKKSKKQPINREHKDHLFRFAFQDKKDLLELYNAVNGTEYQNPDDLIITTLEDAIYLGMKNDLSFIIGSTLNLYEHQSTWNANMPLRGLLYFATLYQEFVDRNGYNLYGGRKIELPIPQYMVFYNGNTEEPDQVELTLSDAFQKSDREIIPCLECKVRVLNINRGHNQELLEKCQRLWEYSEFIGQVKENLKAGMNIRDAVNSAMDSCCSKGILTDILSRCRTEVLAMLLTEYDEKKMKVYYCKEGVDQVNELFSRLLADGRQKDLERSLTDREYQKKLFQEYGIHIEDISMM